MIYDFICPSCHKKYDEVFSIGQAKETECPKCGTVGLRVFSVHGFKINIQDSFFSYQTGTHVKNKHEEEHQLQQLDAVN